MILPFQVFLSRFRAECGEIVIIVDNGDFEEAFTGKPNVQRYILSHQIYCFCDVRNLYEQS